MIYTCYGDISYHTPKMDSSNLNIFSELSSLGVDNFSREGNQTGNFSLVFVCIYFGVFLPFPSYKFIVNKSQIVNKIIHHFRGLSRSSYIEQMWYLVVAARMAIDEWLYTVLLNGSTNVAS